MADTMKIRFNRSSLDSSLHSVLPGFKSHFLASESQTPCLGLLAAQTRTMIHKGEIRDTVDREVWCVLDWRVLNIVPAVYT
jgi:hypothetical protein